MDAAGYLIKQAVASWVRALRTLPFEDAVRMAERMQGGGPPTRYIDRVIQTFGRSIRQPKWRHNLFGYVHNSPHPRQEIIDELKGIFRHKVGLEPDNPFTIKLPPGFKADYVSLPNYPKVPLIHPETGEKLLNLEFAKTLASRAKSPKVTLAHGTSREMAESLLKYGPRSNLDQLVWGRTGRLEPIGTMFHELGQPGMHRIPGYAARKWRVTGGDPVRLLVDFPRELLSAPNIGWEPQIPRSLWKYVTNPRIKKYTPKEVEGYV